MKKHTPKASPIAVNLSSEASIELCWMLIHNVVAETTDKELERIVTETAITMQALFEFEDKRYVIGIDVEAVRRAFLEKRARDRADQRFLTTLKEWLQWLCPQLVTENRFFEALSEALTARRGLPEREGY
jgi:hypothetical protein